MEEEKLAYLFKCTYTQQSTSIADATNEITQFLANPNFYLLTISIINKPDVYDAQVRNCGIYCLKKGIVQYWGNFPPDFKQLIINHIPQIIISSSEGMLGNVESLCSIIIKSSVLSNEWPISSFLETINTLMSSNDERQVTASLVLIKSVTKYLKNPKDDMLSFYQSFSEAVSAFIPHCICNFNNILIHSYIFHIVSRLSIKVISNGIQSCIPNLISSFLTTIVSLDLNNPYSPRYIIQSSKFIVHTLKLGSNLIPDEQKLQIVRVLPPLLAYKQGANTRNYKGKIIKLLNEIIVQGKNIDNFSFVLMPLVTEVIYPLFSLTENDMEEMHNDPVTFVQENHKICPNWDDTKASCSRFLSNLSKSDAFVGSVYQFALNVYQSSIQTPQGHYQIFSAFHVLSSVVYKTNNHVFEFIKAIFPMFNDNSPILRCSAFLYLSQVHKIEFNEEILQLCFSHLTDPFPLASYYASISFSNLLNSAINTPYQENLKQSLLPNVQNLYIHFSKMASEYQDSYLADGLSNIVLLFQEAVYPFGEQLFAQLFSYFSAACIDELNDPSNSDISTVTSDSLIKMIELLGKDPNLNNSFFNIVSQGLEPLAKSEHFSDLMNFCTKIIEVSQMFNDNYWNVIPLILKIIETTNVITFDEVCPFIEQLIFKDTQLQNKIEIINTLSPLIINQIQQALNQNDEIDSISLVASALIIRCPNNLQIIQPLMQLIEIASNSELCFYGVSMVFSAIIINYFELAQMASQNLIRAWIEGHAYPLYIVSMLKMIKPLEPLQCEMIVSAVKCISDTANDEIDEDLYGGDEDDDMFDGYSTNPSSFTSVSIKSPPPWYNTNELLQQFYNLLTAIQRENLQLWQNIGGQLEQTDIDLVQFMQQLPQIATKL
ncbi:Importin-beta N-terminal domain containing protein [Histomonas meleagridis]|uniref:Importin-beta N-terminal domain containing protein n=1 Tax=Histomonas meleagridis TaxID=135588 RepID=UPI00355A9E3C|nr:Importin-beta N-terminal domain containing protein [Histomonas meleagridis]KAH0805686.1 Importin-beta N-terminal domain containing protein [Histomonas meleagridis]